MSPLLDSGLPKHEASQRIRLVDPSAMCDSSLQSSQGCLGILGEQLSRPASWVALTSRARAYLPRFNITADTLLAHLR